MCIKCEKICIKKTSIYNLNGTLKLWLTELMDTHPLERIRFIIKDDLRREETLSSRTSGVLNAVWGVVVGRGRKALVFI